MSTKNILILGDLPLDINDIKGGVESVIRNLIDGFDGMPDIQLYIMTYSRDINESKILKYSANIELIYVPYRVNIDIIDYFINTGYLKQVVAKKQIDIIHVQGATPHLLRLLRQKRDNIIVTQHGIMLHEYQHVKGMARKLKFLFKIFIENCYFPLFRHVIFISNYNQKLYKGDPSTQITLCNPVNEIFFSDNEFVCSQSIMYVGAINVRKNLMGILEALQVLKSRELYFNLNVVGGFQDAKYKSIVMTYIEENELTDQVTFHGWLKQNAIHKLYKKSSYLILNSYQETLPVSISEAMSMGKIVLASDVGAISEMFEPNESGFLISDSDSIVKTLMRLHNDLQLQQKISRNAIKVAEDYYHPLKVANLTGLYYNQVINYKGS